MSHQVCEVLPVQELVLIHVSPTASPLLVFHGAKGGVGTSVVAAGTAVLAAERQPTLLIDLAGDQAMIFGLPTPSASLSDWLRADQPHPDSLARLEVRFSPRLSLLGVQMGRCLPPADRLRALAQVLANEPRTVVVDLGRLAQPGVALLQAANRSLLVTRPCYMALQAAMTGPSPDGVVLVSERGRALGRRDVSLALGVPVEVQLWTDNAVARSVDAGILGNRLPRSLRPLEGLLS